MYEDISTVNKLYILITPDSDLYYFIRASLAKLPMYSKNLFWVMAANIPEMCSNSLLNQKSVNL